MNRNYLKQLASSPALFRDALLIDTDDGPIRFGSVIDDWQRKDFEALDSGWLQVADRPTNKKKTFTRAYLERPRGHSKTLDLAVQIT